MACLFHLWGGGGFQGYISGVNADEGALFLCLVRGQIVTDPGSQPWLFMVSSLQETVTFV